MLVHSRPRAAALGIALLALAGCSAAPPAPLAGAHPADPDAPVRASAYRPVIAAGARERPRDPSDWRRSNERVAPREKP